LDYAALKDFAGPVATVIAAAAAAYFAWQQSRTGKRQAETAVDQLRYNLFEKRFAMYREIMQVIWLSTSPEVTHLEPHQYKVFTEIEFFFSPATCRWAKDVLIECQKLILARKEGETIDNSPSYLELKAKLIGHALAMPRRFGDELSFYQLTGRAQRSALKPGISGNYINLIMWSIGAKHRIKRAWKARWGRPE